VMAPGWEVEAIPQVVRAAGVVPPETAAPR